MSDQETIQDLDERIVRAIELDNAAAYFYQQYLKTKQRISELQEKAEIQLFTSKEKSLQSLKELDAFGMLSGDLLTRLHQENADNAKKEARS